MADDDFDVALWIDEAVSADDDGDLAGWRYCLKAEYGHLIYHRFAQRDFELRWPDVR